VDDGGDGVIDAVIEKQTGILVDVRNVDALTAAMLDLSRNATRRQLLGRQALNHVSKTFASETVTAA